VSEGALPAAYPGLSLRAAGRRVASGLSPTAAQLAAFGALAVLVAWRWLDLVVEPPSGRGVAAVAIALAGACALAILAQSSTHRRARVAAVAATAVITTVAGLLAVGLPLHLLAPARWGELGRGLRSGLDGAFGGDYPYTGSGQWTRIVLLCGLPLVLGVAATLAFAGRSEGTRRRFALAILVGAWATAAALSPPADPVLWGVALFAAVAAWLWLGRAPRAGAAPGVVVLVLAAALAAPLAAALDRNGPVLDYRNWDISFSSAAPRTISYSWDHTYGPLRWPRGGHTLFTVVGSSPQYWRTTVLDRFDGLRWLTSADPGGRRFQLPATAEQARSAGTEIAALDTRWVHTATFNVRELDSQLVVAPGTVLRLKGLNGATADPTGVSLPADAGLSNGASYSVVAYEPDPDPSDFRHLPARLSPGLRRYTEIGLPHVTPGTVPTDSLGRAIQLGRKPADVISVRTIEMPLWGRPGGAADRRALERSAYGDVYALAKRVTRTTATEYGAVRAVDHYLRNHYEYNESPPRASLPLRAFLFRDRIGYCQQFSGAMALMLRTIGIPARVASGFSPGIPNPNGGGWAVRDLDAHSWVEVYFNTIGWVPFDPTPAAAPASSQFARPAGVVLRRQSRPFPNQPGSPNSEVASGFKPTRAGSGPGAWPWIVALVALTIAAAVFATARRRSRFLAMSPAEATTAQSRELGSLAAGLGLQRRHGITLLELERRLGTIAGPKAAAYAATLRAARYGTHGGAPPTLRERRALRAALFAGSGIRRRFAGLIALPPGAPR
jgi:transglutaminase-like putative cysteine protease